MKELGITKGEWGIENKFDHKHDQDIFAINSKFSDEILNEEFISVWTWMIEEEAEANAQLIADAGTTANKCNLLPSELLERYNEAIEVLKGVERLKDLLQYPEDTNPEHWYEAKAVSLMLSEVEQTISKAKGE